MGVSTRRHFLKAAVAVAASSQLALSQTLRKWPLWLIEKHGGRALLVGESLPRSNDWHDSRIETLLDGCSGMWNETNQTYRKSPKELVERFGMVPSGSTSSSLTHEDEARLAKAADFCKISLADLAGARPWLIGATLEEAYFHATGLTGKSANEVLSAQATKAGLPVSSEFAVKDDVFAWFGSMSPEQDVQFLRFVLDGIEIGPAGTERISSSCANGDFAPATSMVEEERTLHPSLYQMLTVERTRSWVPRFEAALQSGKQHLFVLGLYHVIGPDGLPVQLQRAGFKTSRL